MNVCLVLISEGWGGAETVVYELARHLRDKGENVSIILNQEIIKFYNDLEGIEIFNVGYAYNHRKLIKSIIFPNSKTNGEADLSSFPWSILNELLRPIYFKRIRKQINKFLHENNFNIIHIHTLINSGILVSSLNNIKIPTIATIHHPLSFVGKESINPIIKWKAGLYKRALEKMDKITLVSDLLLSDFEKWIPLRDKSMIIPNGIRLSEFQGDSIQSLKLKAQFNLLFPGGAKPSKGGDILIEALHRIKKEVSNIHLYIALNVPQNHLLRKMVKDFGLEENVTFSGFLPLQEYRSLLNSIDVLCMPSKEEAFGIVFLEAMAMGKPIIAANRGGIPELIVNGRNGILIEPDSDEVANAILYLYENEDLRKEMGQNNLGDIKKFDWNPIVDKYIDLYKKTLKTK